ncbi:unnamed protein product [Tilletia controversa]|uniref:Uncharacterized protein n=3 Tax=Tilletia TaxID=13289 RepID=A0A8X7STR3_9BASI|nr:hypothetical protein CF336_g6675 [Tilletia laevis]KAE8195156.1 hypothetical protein CF328_g4528 [Tilletia controversa]KAE8252468.1 hypothetical protein A4X03_0g6153 [Tilletia caries]KAE8192120.1 hypothetical protein CF335_g5918 [Tilletia laevis]KAE8241018.1 hypothetical protein A4X06_0g7692 [Tilletia controversa]
MVSRLRHLQLRFGISVAAVMSSREEGTVPFLALSAQSKSALVFVINCLQKGKTADNLATNFDRGVKLRTWERSPDDPPLDSGKRAAASETPPNPGTAGR